VAYGAKTGKKATPKTAPKAKFVLVYQGSVDPDATTVEQIIKTFSPATVKEVVPGTLKIEGDSAKIKRRAGSLESWSLAPEGVMSIRSPSQTRFDQIRR
jgi:hypothetical protein